MPQSQYEFSLDGNCFLYKIQKERKTQEDYAVLLKVTPCKGSLCIPAFVEGLPVKELDKKVFFNSPGLREIYLPDTLEAIGDWAFAHCNSLNQISMPQKKLSLGRGLFSQSDRLAKIQVGQKAQEAPLVAAAVLKLEADYLFCPPEIGTKEWYGRLDARLLEKVSRPDEEGYIGLMFGGEEDYDNIDMATFCKEKRKDKVRLCLLRLSSSKYLEESVGQKLRAYLAAHVKGCQTEETWEVLLSEHGDERAYYELLADLEGIWEQNLDGMLADMGEDHLEMKAWLMRYKQEKFGQGSFFQKFSLDF